MNPMVPAEAPSRARYAPRMLDAPSWVMSENRLTMPNSTMKTMAWDIFLLRIMVSSLPAAFLTAHDTPASRFVKGLRKKGAALQAGRPKRVGYWKASDAYDTPFWPPCK